MSNIFTPVRIFSQSGAKLYFRATGTSTPQNTYQDADLTTPHANPVVAASDGYFPKIYLDPSLPDYRFIHTDGSDAGNDYTLEVLLEPIQDDIPAAQGTHTALRIKSTSPTVIWEETDQSSGNQKWYGRASGNVFEIGPLNAAESSFTAAISIARDGTVSYEGAEIATTVSGTFTGTLTGITTTVTGTIRYTITGGVATVTVPAAFSGTSNSTACTISGMPDALKPATAKTASIPAFVFVDNSVSTAAVAVRMDPSSNTIPFIMNGSLTGFNSSGSKGAGTAFSFTYPLT